MSQLPTKPAEVFLWGQGGRRMTPQDISRERQIAASLMQPDYSPIQSPWQGLARVAGNVTGALRERKANKAQDANAAASRQIAESLFGGGSTASAPVDMAGGWTVPVDGSPSVSPPPGVSSSSASGGGVDATILAALTDPYLDPTVKSMAQNFYEQRQPVRQKVGNDFIEFNPVTGATKKLYEGQSDDAFTRMMVNAGIDPASPQGREIYAKRVNAMADPEIVVPMPSGTYIGPRSGLRDAMQPAQLPDTLPPDFDFGDGGPAAPQPGGF